jgi:alkaline phosphatase D
MVQRLSYNQATPISQYDEDQDHTVEETTGSDGVFHSQQTQAPVQPSSYSRWYVRILTVFTVVLLALSIGLLVSRNTTKTSFQPSPSRTSELLLNATIPQWKPLPNANQTITKIAFGSCASQSMPQPHWDTIVLQEPDLFLLMGDNVYGDCTTSECMELREAYREFSLHPSIQGGAPLVSVFATLDDHDYGQNNCNMMNPYKDKAKQLFQEFFQLTSDSLPWHDGVYRSQIFGVSGTRVQIILLDTRYSRSPFIETGKPSSPYKPEPEDNIDQQMLSPSQWLWLENQIRESADLRIIVSSIQVLNKVTGFEAWRQLPMEQQRLFKLLKDETVIFVSGDRHVGGIYEADNFVEVTASSLTHTTPFGAFDNCSSAQECDEIDPARIGNLIRQNHYGWIDIDWKASTVTLSIRRTESTLGSTYSHLSTFPHSDAGVELTRKQYAFSEL